MTDQEITALAREYAEEKCGNKTESPMYFGLAEGEMEEKLRWLSRRYCLVEKDKAREVYAEQTFRYDPDRDLASIVVEHVLNRLFPEIAKEAEG